MLVEENNSLPLKAADQFIFPSSTCGAVVYPLFFPILTRVSRIDSKSEKLVRILVYGPWQEKKTSPERNIKGKKSHLSFGAVLCLWLLRDSRDESCSWISVQSDGMVERSSEAKRPNQGLSDHGWTLEVVTWRVLRQEDNRVCRHSASHHHRGHVCVCVCSHGSLVSVLFISSL